MQEEDTRTLNTTPMSLPTVPKERLTAMIEQYRTEAEEAKKAQNYEFAFMLIDQADTLERQLEDSVAVYRA